MMDDDEAMTVEVIQPMRHNRWAVIVPALALAANIADDIADTFKAYVVFASQHGMQKHYDSRFNEIVKGS